MIFRVKWLIIQLLVFSLVCSLIVPVSFAETRTSNVDNGGYIVKPHIESSKIITSRFVYDTIIQGQTNWYNKYVTEDITTLVVDLNWGNPSNSLRLKIYTADNVVLGPYYDSADGAIDGRIHLDIYNPNGIAKGTWSYEAYGYRVTGTEDYYI